MEPLPPNRKSPLDKVVRVDSPEVRELKQRLFDTYGGFIDKRTKNLAKGDTFIIDDRKATDFDDHGHAYSSLCMATARVRNAKTVELHLQGSTPVNEEIRRQAPALGATISWGERPTLDMEVTPGKLNCLEGLATQVQGIVRRGAPEYSVRSYKHACPRTAKTLRRLKKILKQQWGSGPVATE
jgi:hypothetical protein